MFCSYLLRERILSFLLVELAMKTTPTLKYVGVVLFQSSARVESLGTALASTTLQAKPAWARGKAKQVPQCI